ncbi:MAG: hypothetical protein M1823_003521 [Watsoniomyces obsoletus]|nr:MAG: hypothetical protein M1823_003521 [Watsoniomyces obsoletus]
MPHKHRRDQSKNKSISNLPPSIIAKPLPVSKGLPAKTQTGTEGSKNTLKKKPKREGPFDEDDTPKAFTRLMQLQAHGRYPSGLDDGSGGRRASKKRKRDDEKATTEGQVATGRESNEVPKIQPGEKMSDFVTRVNAALPLSGVAKKGGASKDAAGLKPKQTRMERKMQKMQAEWRKEESRLQEKRREALEELEGDDMFDDDATLDKSHAGHKKGKKRKVVDEDPWEAIRVARNEPRRSLHDVVKAPPKLTHKPRPVFGVANGARVDVDNVPKGAGSLKRREELGLARRDILAQYRTMMEGRRGAES